MIQLLAKWKSVQIHDLGKFLYFSMRFAHLMHSVTVSVQQTATKMAVVARPVSRYACFTVHIYEQIPENISIVTLLTSNSSDFPKFPQMLIVSSTIRTKYIHQPVMHLATLRASQSVVTLCALQLQMFVKITINYYYYRIIITSIYFIPYMVMAG